MIYAVLKGHLVHASEAKSGEHYQCPECLSPLVIKKGKVREHHFAHKDLSKCIGHPETFLHRQAKTIIAEEKRFKTPGFKSNGKLISSRMVEFDTIEQEVTIGSIKVDLMGRVGLKQLAIEIKVTHGIEDAELLKTKKLNLAMIEVDLSNYDGLLKTGTLREFLVDGERNKKWINNPRFPQSKPYYHLPDYSKHAFGYNRPPDEPEIKPSKSESFQRLQRLKKYLPAHKALVVDAEGMVICPKIELENQQEREASNHVKGASVNQRENKAFTSACSFCEYFGGTAMNKVLCSGKAELS